MLKFMHIIIMVLFISEFLIFHCSAFTCIHDEIVQKYPTSLKRSLKYKDIKEQRDRKKRTFVPLRVYFYVDNFDSSVSVNVIHNIELALRKVRDYIAETFQVQERKKTFVLERQSCTRRWQAGPNKGKCSKITNEPEYCVSQEIAYPIPDRFLDELELFDYDSQGARYKLPSGHGLIESNFITFVTSEPSRLCEGSDVSAFGSFCRVDRVTNEPLAGILNFCPAYFSRKIYSFEHYYNIILHEMFHILGFSIHLFEKFIPCHKGMHCDIPKNVIQTDSYGVPRLIYPLVIKKMQEHFSCANSDFGGPMVLEVTNSPEQEDETQHYTSHWDPVLMYSSVMMAQFSEYDHVFVDNITLSVFDSTGWYLVNYSQADNFIFGKGQGCGFGLNTTCENNPYLCNPNATNKLGCDLTHKSIGLCSSLSPHRKCGVYHHYNKESCDFKIGKQFGLDFYALGYQQKCFMLSEENNVTASCLPVKCKTNNSYSILINMTWYECFSQQMINAEKLSVLCPESTLFCSKEMVKKSSLQRHCPAESNFFIAVLMHFTQPIFDDLYDSRGFKNFKVSILRGIAEEIDIPVNYIVNSSLSVFKKIQLDFIICPNLVKSTDELNEILKKVQTFLDSGSFIKILGINMIASSMDVKMDPLDSISFSDHEGFRTLLIYPVICAIFLTATLIASIIRFLFSKKH